MEVAPHLQTQCSGPQFVGKARQLFGGDSASDDAPEQCDDDRLNKALAASGGSRRALAAAMGAEAPEGPRKRKKKRRDARQDGDAGRGEEGLAAEQAQEARLRALLDSGDVPPLGELQVCIQAPVYAHTRAPGARVPARVPRESRRCPSCSVRPSICACIQAGAWCKGTCWACMTAAAGGTTGAGNCTRTHVLVVYWQAMRACADG